MKNAAKQYSFIKKDMVSIEHFSWFKGAKDGFPNGSNDLKNMVLKVSKIRAVPQNESGEKLQSIWLIPPKAGLSGKNWNLTKLVVLPSLALERRLYIGSLNKERFIMFHLSLLLLRFSFARGRQEEPKPKEIGILNPILTLKQRRWETSIRQTSLGRDTSGVPKVLPDSIPFILWMWQGIQYPQVSLPINSPFLCANTWLKHGDILEFPMYLRWIMKWLPQGEDVILIAFLRSFVSICSWESIWYLSLKENQAEMPRWRVLIDSGRKECLEDIIVLHLLLLKEPVNDFCGITIMRNHTGALLKKNMAQDSPGCSEITSGNPLDICQKVLPSQDVSIPKDILISPLQREGFPLSERLTLVAKLRLMELLISSEENLKVNMLLLLSLLIERDWLLNKIRLLNLSLSQLRVMLLLLYFLIQRANLKFSSRCYYTLKH
jgi:hypothetical protein